MLECLAIGSVVIRKYGLVGASVSPWGSALGILKLKTDSMLLSLSATC